MLILGELEEAKIEKVNSLPTDSKKYRIVGYNNYLYYNNGVSYTKLSEQNGDAVFNDLSVYGNISVTGNVDGRDISDDGDNLDLHLASATGHTDVQLNNNHRVSSGIDHGYIDQDVTVNADTKFIGSHFGPTGDTKEASAIVEMESVSKGFLAPRMNTSQREAISSPAIGLIVFDTDLDTYYQYKSTGWAEMGGGGSGVLDGTDKRLGLASISVIDTDVDVYAPAGANYAFKTKLTISNYNKSEVAKVRVANRDGAIADDDYLIYDISLGPESPPIGIEIPGLTTLDTVTVRSSVTGCNFALFGEETTTNPEASIFSRHSIVQADVKENLANFTGEGEVDFFFCNRNASETAKIKLFLGDGVTSDEDIVYQDQILPNQSKSYTFDDNIGNGYVADLISSCTGLSAQVYTRGLSGSQASMFLPAEVQLKRDSFYSRKNLSQNYVLTGTLANITDFEADPVTKTGYYKVNSLFTFLAAAGGDDCYAAIAINGTPLDYTYQGAYNSGSDGYFPYNMNLEKILLEEGDIVSIQAKYDNAGGRINYATGFVTGFLEVVETGSLVDYVKNPYQVDYPSYDISAYVSDSNLTVYESLATFYKDMSNQWYTDLDIIGQYSSAVTETNIVISILTFKSVATISTGFAGSVSRGSGGAGRVYAESNSNVLRGRDLSSTSEVAVSFKRVPLASKPTII